jgi:type VI secretion system secreted protein VgrG
VAGPETAIVTGSAEEKSDGIYVDEYGRVRVQFHWDRDGKLDDKSSCWVRVSQTGHLGNIIIPRVGSEVLVDFINGDPDRPIIVGRVFNSEYKPIYALPEHKAKAVWRTKRYKESKERYENAKKLDVEPTGANEIRLDDKGGEEEFFIYAEKQMTTRVRLDETHHVGRDQVLKVGYDRTKIVENNEKVEITKNRDVKIDETDKLVIKSKLTTEVTHGDEERKISANQKIEVGKTIKIEAGTEIQIIVGSSKITLSQSGVKIEGTQLQFAGTAQAKMTAPMTTTEASGLMVVKGALVKIN